MPKIACYVTRFHKDKLPYLKAHWEHHSMMCFDGIVGLDPDCQDEESIKLVESLGLKWCKNNGSFFNNFYAEVYEVAKSLYPDQWILTLDSDEYIACLDVDKLTNELAEDPSDWVAGWLCDRFGPGGKLLPCPTTSYEAMVVTYPIAATFTRDVMKACDTKVLFRKTFKDMHDSPGKRSNILLRVDHIKWTDTTEKDLTVRIEQLKNADYVWQYNNAKAAIRGDSMFLGDSWIRTQSNIEGWFDYEDLYQMIARECPQDAHLVELGVWMGKSASYLVQNLSVYNKQYTLWLVDYFRDPFNSYARYSRDMGVPAENTKLSYLHRTVNNLQKYNQLENTAILQCNSTQAARLFDNKQCYFVFVDADHSYESCKADIKAWLPKISCPGVIAGHDYDWPSVKKAVDEIFGTSVKLNYNNKAWFVRV